MEQVMMARFTALPGRVDALQQAVDVLARAVRKEPGNEGFDVFQAADDPHAFTMIERYTNAAAFHAHAAMPHTAAFNAALAQLTVTGAPEVTQLTPQATGAEPAHAIRGIDHVGITVPDIAAASGFLERAVGAIPLYDVQSETAPPMAGAEVEQQLGVPPGAQITHMRLMRIGNAANIELFQFAEAPQADAAGLQDFGLQHIALYTDDIGEAAARFADAGGTLLSPPHDLAAQEGGPHNRGVYGRAPWGTLIEFIATPDGVDYPADCAFPRWKPRPNLGG